MARLEVGQRIRLALAPEYTGAVTEVLEIPDDELYMVQLDNVDYGAVRYSRAVLEEE